MTSPFHIYNICSDWLCTKLSYWRPSVIHECTFTFLFICSYLLLDFLLLIDLFAHWFTCWLINWLSCLLGYLLAFLLTSLLIDLLIGSVAYHWLTFALLMDLPSGLHVCCLLTHELLIGVFACHLLANYLFICLLFTSFPITCSSTYFCIAYWFTYLLS